MSVHRKDVLHNSPAERVRVMIGVKIASDIEYIKINALRACRVRGEMQHASMVRKLR